MPLSVLSPMLLLPNTSAFYYALKGCPVVHDWHTCPMLLLLLLTVLPLQSPAPVVCAAAAATTATATGIDPDLQPQPAQDRGVAADTLGGCADAAGSTALLQVINPHTTCSTL